MKQNNKNQNSNGVSLGRRGFIIGSVGSAIVATVGINPVSAKEVENKETVVNLKVNKPVDKNGDVLDPVPLGSKIDFDDIAIELTGEYTKEPVIVTYGIKSNENRTYRVTVQGKADVVAENGFPRLQTLLDEPDGYTVVSGDGLPQVPDGDTANLFVEVEHPDIPEQVVREESGQFGILETAGVTVTPRGDGIDGAAYEEFTFPHTFFFNLSNYDNSGRDLDIYWKVEVNNSTVKENRETLANTNTVNKKIPLNNLDIGENTVTITLQDDGNGDVSVQDIERVDSFEVHKYARTHPEKEDDAVFTIDEMGDPTVGKVEEPSEYQALIIEEDTEGHIDAETDVTLADDAGGKISIKKDPLDPDSPSINITDKFVLVRKNGDLFIRADLTTEKIEVENGGRVEISDGEVTTEEVEIGDGGTVNVSDGARMRFK